MNNSPYCISISKEALAGLPMVAYTANIKVVDTLTEAQKAMEALLSVPVVGIDTETRPAFQKGRTHQVALIQISTPDTAYLFRINKIGFIQELRDFLENKDIVKVGLSLKDDFMGLHRQGNFEPASIVELQSYVKDFGITDASLQKIYGIIFGQRISKAQRLSNWEAAELTSAQQHYAALDAWACLNLYDHLSNGRFDPSQSPYIIEQQ